MFVDGIYEIAFARRNRSPRAGDRAILVCRDGTLFGADPRGRVYRGTLHPIAKRAMRKSFLSAFYEIATKIAAPDPHGSHEAKRGPRLR